MSPALARMLRMASLYYKQAVATCRRCILQRAGGVHDRLAGAYVGLVCVNRHILKVILPARELEQTGIAQDPHWLCAIAAAAGDRQPGGRCRMSSDSLEVRGGAPCHAEERPDSSVESASSVAMACLQGGTTTHDHHPPNHHPPLHSLPLVTCALNYVLLAYLPHPYSPLLTCVCGPACTSGRAYLALPGTSWW